MKPLRQTATLAALAAFLGLGALAASSTPAAAWIYRTNCFGDACERVRCDNDGDYCVRVSSYPYHGITYRYRYVCDADGVDCRYVRTRYYYNDYDFDYDEFEY